MKTKVNTFFACVGRSRQVVRNVVAYGIVCMLLFAITSCDNSDDSFVSEEFAILGEMNAAGHFTAKFYVFEVDCGYLLFLDTGSAGHFHNIFFAPTNLPQKFQRAGLHVNVVLRPLAIKKCGRPAMEIIEIEEVAFSSKFYDSDFSNNEE